MNRAAASGHSRTGGGAGSAAGGRAIRSQRGLSMTSMTAASNPGLLHDKAAVVALGVHKKVDNFFHSIPRLENLIKFECKLQIQPK